MASHAELDPDLDEKVAAAFGQPAANAMADAIRDDVKETGPIDEGLLRSLAASEHGAATGTTFIARMVSSRPADDGQSDVAAWVEFGTKHMSPRRYSAASARRATQKLGYGRFTQATQPWPAK